MSARRMVRPWPGRVRPAIAAGAAVLLLAACGTPEPVATKLEPAPTAQPRGQTRSTPLPDTFALATRNARIVDAGRHLECVVYARDRTGIALRGDAGTWWHTAAGRYERGTQPQPGSVLVLKPTGRSAGHLAVVRAVLGPRLVVADHANWLNNGRIHEGTPIEDVSAAGDWSAVRVWYVPGGTWGRTRYAAFGFVHPRSATVAGNAAR